MDNSSESGIKFGFSKPNANKDNQKEEVTKEVEQVENKVIKEVEADDDLNLEYTDERSVTVMLVKNYSLYRRHNDKVLPKRQDFIGSSIHSSRILSSNKKEVEAYFPNIIGLSPSDPNFIIRVKQYLNNFKIPVDELGKTFNISFIYNHKKDYIRIAAEEEKIEEEYQKSNKQNLKDLKKALKIKIDRLNTLESSKYEFGRPLYVEDYLIYRHCLLYNSIAKDIALIDSDSNIRFYFKDDKKEANKLRKFRVEVNKAKANYVSCLADDVLFDAVYTQYCVLNNLPIISSLAEDRLEREIKLDKFSTDEPIKFNKIYAKKEIRLMANIEMLIARGELNRSQYNQNITTQDGEFVGANIEEAVAWFKNPENRSYTTALENKLNNI